MLKEEDPQTKDPKLQLNDSGISSEENQEAHSQWAEDKESLLSFFKLRLAPRTADIAVTSEDFHQEFQSDIQNHSTESRSVSLSDLSKILKSESFWHEISTMESEVRPQLFYRKILFFFHSFELMTPWSMWISIRRVMQCQNRVYVGLLDPWITFRRNHSLPPPHLRIRISQINSER